jgi:CAAX protease family protein
MDIIVLLTVTAAAAVAVAGFASYVLKTDQLPLVIVIQGLVILAALRAMLAYRRQTWRDIGLRTLQGVDLGRGLLTLLACVGVNMVLTSSVMLVNPDLFKRHAHNLMEVGERLDGGLPFVVLGVVILFVGVYEELTARGLLLSRCRTVLPGTWAPIIASAVIFGLGHAYQGWLGVAQTTLIGIVLAYYTLRWGTLWPAIVAHTTLDLTSLAVIRYATEHNLLLSGCHCPM